jgi:Protein of unknown function (DUF2442)
MSSTKIHLQANRVSVQEREFSVLLKDGRTIAIPFSWFRRLAEANPSQREHYRLIGGGQGIHWPDIDEDLSVDGLLAEVKRRSFTANLPPSSQVAFTVSQPEGRSAMHTSPSISGHIPDNNQSGICAEQMSGSQSSRPAA